MGCFVTRMSSYLTSVMICITLVSVCSQTGHNRSLTLIVGGLASNLASFKLALPQAHPLHRNGYVSLGTRPFQVGSALGHITSPTENSRDKAETLNV